jgi:hypothetical protein
MQTLTSLDVFAMHEKPMVLFKFVDLHVTKTLSEMGFHFEPDRCSTDSFTWIAYIAMSSIQDQVVGIPAAMHSAAPALLQRLKMALSKSVAAEQGRQALEKVQLIKRRTLVLSI